VITPNGGYTLQASDFFIGSILPAEVISVSFADSGTALDPANTIIATVTLASWYVMPNASTGISVDIDGRTHTYQPRLSFTNVTNVVTNVTDSLTLSTVTSPAVNSLSSATVGSITTDTCFIDIPANLNTNVAQVVITAADDYHLAASPSYEIASTNSSNWSSVISSTVLNANNQLKSVVYDFHYNMGSTTVPASLGESIVWTIPEATPDRVAKVSVGGAYYEYYRNESILPAYDKTLSLNVTGNEGATYNIKIEDSNGLTYDFSSDTFTRGFTISSEQTIYSREKQLVTGGYVDKNEYAIFIPAYYKGSSYEVFFTTTITPTGSTKTNAAGDSTTPHVITLRQFGEVYYVLGIQASDDGTTPSNTTAVALLNKKPLVDLDSFVPELHPERSTNNNGYFSYSEALAYSITDTVDGAFSGRTMLLDNSYVTKKVQIGDIITGTNIDTATVIEDVNVSGNPNMYTISKSPIAQVADGTVITLVRTVGISRQPLASDVNNAIPGIGYANGGSFSVKTVFPNSNLIEMQGLDSESTDITTGMSVEGDNIVGYPLVASASGANIVLSSSQSLTIGDTLNFSAGGNRMEFESISVTGAGTSNCKLNIIGNVERMGKGDTTDVLILNNFITAYEPPTIATAVAACNLNSSITIEPLPGCTSHTGGLTIATIPSDGSGSAVISGDGKSILYLAPKTGVSDTITYTINDGVSATTAAANIVITLTP
tara:strand:- start:1827 stop:3977 length:2151 start_codon:yes stop_codon:yes gene_type:complete